MNELPDAKILVSRLASTYADAVMSFLHTGQAQGIEYDPDELDFMLRPIEPDTSTTNLGLSVGERWQDYVGDIGMTTDPAHREFSAAALRKAIADRLESSGLMRKIALSIAADRLNRELEALRDETLPH